jgi:hypothetical protein
MNSQLRISLNYRIGHQLLEDWTGNGSVDIGRLRRNEMKKGFEAIEGCVIWRPNPCFDADA